MKADVLMHCTVPATASRNELERLVEVDHLKLLSIDGGGVENLISVIPRTHMVEIKTWSAEMVNGFIACLQSNILGVTMSPLNNAS